VNRREFVVGAVTLPVALRFAPGALAGGTPAALVTADTQSRVAVVELSSGRILRSIPTLASATRKALLSTLTWAAGSSRTHAVSWESTAPVIVP